MRIGLVVRRFDSTGGGTERDLLITARILIEAGYEVTIYASEVRDDVSPFDVREIQSTGIGRTWRLCSFAARAAEVARRDGATLILSFARIVDADILRSGGGAHANYVEAARQWQGTAARLAMALSRYHRAQMAIERRGFASTILQRVIAVSDLVRRQLIATFELTPSKVVTLYNGVDLERFRPSSRECWRSAVRRALEIPDAVPLVAFVGNGFARKGLQFLIEAWPQIDSAAMLVVAGVDRAVPSYQRRARSLGVAERIRFIGTQPQIEKLFAAADAFALPSLFEPFGNVVMEAMAAGLPVLCSSACGASELLAPAMREFVVANPTNVGELAARLHAILKVGGDLGETARATAEQYTWECHAANLLKIIRGM